MKLVAADVRRLTFSRTWKIRASLRRLLRFTGSTLDRHCSFLASRARGVVFQEANNARSATTNASGWSRNK